MKLAAAKSIVHHHTIENMRMESLVALKEANEKTIQDLTKLPNELSDWLEFAEAELSTLEEQRVLLIKEIGAAKQKLQRPIEGLREAEHTKKIVYQQIASAERKLSGYKTQLPEALKTLADYKQRETDRLANEILDGIELMEELEALTVDQRVERMKKIRHDKRVESQKEKGRHFHRMFQKNTTNSDEAVVMVPCHGARCNFCPQPAPSPT